MIDLQELQNSLTNDEIITLLTNLGADRYEEKAGYIIFPTICHNIESSEASMKLYYYEDNKVFKCYTECDEAFNIFGLVNKRFTLLGKNRVETREEKINENDYTFYDIIRFILNSTQIQVSNGQEYYKSLSKKYEKNEDPILLNFNKGILNVFSKYYPIEWLQEDISENTMDVFDIRFSKNKNTIIIPHYDLNSNLIGIRGRALDEEEIKYYGKYHPVEIEGIMYSHPLSLNLYGLNIAKDAIKRKKKVIIFEGEKSVLKSYEYYKDNSIAVASCGSHININQIKLLIKNFDINEIIIALDKEYTNYHEMSDYGIKIKNMCKKYSQYCDFSIIKDKQNILGFKDSPIDRGKQNFESLLNNRERVN